MKRSKNIKITINNAEFNVKVLGKGSKNVIAFHGFGQDGFAFSPLARNNPEYTFYSFDLPFHGETKIYDSNLCISAPEIVELISKLTDTLEIDRFSVIAFSIGAKFIFPVIQYFYGETDAIWLIAPDGIKRNFWYRISTSTSIMRQFFRTFLLHPKLLRGMVIKLNWLGITDEKTMKFILNSVVSPSARDQIVKTWIYLKDLKINVDDVAAKLNKAEVKVFFVLGTQDNIIQKKMIIPLSNKLINSETIFLDCGHQSLLKTLKKLNLKDV